MSGRWEARQLSFGEAAPREEPEPAPSADSPACPPADDGTPATPAPAPAIARAVDNLLERAARASRRAAARQAEAMSSGGAERRQDARAGAPEPEAAGGQERSGEGVRPGVTSTRDAAIEALMRAAEADGRPSDAALSVGEFYRHVRHALGRAFPEELWVTGEIRQVKDVRGHRYIELTDHVPAGSGDQRNTGCLEATCWARHWPAIRTQLRRAGITLAPGLVVRVRGRVSVWEGTGKIQFSMTGIDIEALLGGMAAARSRLLRALAEEGLLERNRALPLPLVPLRVGLVTSAGSEAYRDFTGQLERSGFAFEVSLQASPVQGPGAPASIAAALRRLRSFEPAVAVIVRGGGGRGDLVAFDDEVVARAIAAAPFPVWTGIGHTGDRSVADEVAHRALITPSACGEALVDRVSEYWEGVVARTRLLGAHARGHLDRRRSELHGAAHHVSRSARHQLDRRSDALVAKATRAASAAGAIVERAPLALVAQADALKVAGRHGVAVEQRHIEGRLELLRAFDPRRQLERGWTLTRDGSGAMVRSVEGVALGSRLVTVFADGQVESSVTERTVSGQPEGRNEAPRRGAGEESQ